MIKMRRRSLSERKFEKGRGSMVQIEWRDLLYRMDSVIICIGKYVNIVV